MRAGNSIYNHVTTACQEMTDEVAGLVLRSNYLQTQALSMMEKFSGPRLGSKQHFISVLEEEGLLDRTWSSCPMTKS